MVLLYLCPESFFSDLGSLSGSTLLFALQEDEEEGEEEFSQVVSTAELDKLQGLVSCSLESSCTDDFFTC